MWFADDVVLLVSPSGLLNAKWQEQKVKTTFASEAAALNRKIRWIFCSGLGISCCLKKFSYLGLLLWSWGKLECEIDKRIKGELSLKAQLSFDWSVLPSNMATSCGQWLKNEWGSKSKWFLAFSPFLLLPTHQGTKSYKCLLTQIKNKLLVCLKQRGLLIIANNHFEYLGSFLSCTETWQHQQTEKAASARVLQLMSHSPLHSVSYSSAPRWWLRIEQVALEMTFALKWFWVHCQRWTRSSVTQEVCSSSASWVASWGVLWI